MRDLGIGIVGGGYMGKAHAVAFRAVAPVFDTALRPALRMVCASTQASAERYRAAYGFAAATDDWRVLVEDPGVEAVVIAAPPEMHRPIVEAACALGKPIFCEKPLGASLADAQAMAAAVKAAGVPNMIGFNYIRTPASQFARKLVAEGRIGDVSYFRGEHTEDFYADPDAPASWRTQGTANGTMGDLAPHIINAARALMAPIAELNAVIETIHTSRGGVSVTNDDQAQMMLRFASGTQGHLFISRVATGRKMGYAYEIHGTTGAIRFDQEDQNAVWLYTRDGPEGEQGFRKILTGPAHPDYLPFCQGPGHGTGYQDQIIIEARDFLHAIETGASVWPTFDEGVEVARVVAAAFASDAARAWVRVEDF
ncbi:MAG: Gfo/Idh/MocA family oxidoreductase [Pseudomonadota bacterium]